MELYLLIGVLILILMGEFVNGWTDAPNAIATVVSTRTLSLRVAIVVATTFNILGAFAGTAVAATIGQGIIQSSSISLITLGAVMIAIIFWGVFAWRFGLPTSHTHALVAGLAGAGLAEAGPSVLLWDGWGKVLIGLVLSTLSGTILGWVFAKIIQILFWNASPGKTRKMFGWMQLFSSSLMAFSHGSNDGQKFIGMFSLALLVGGVFPTFEIPFWVILLCAVTMGIGTSIGGMRIITKMGVKMVHLETYQGFAAETASATTILAASHFGIPLSTTHTIGTAIIGVGMARNAKLVRWNVFIQIVYAWLLTFPVCGLFAFLIASAFQIFGLIGVLLVAILLMLWMTFSRLLE